MFSRKALVASSAAALALLAGCGDDVTVPITPPPPATIAISPATATANVGDTPLFAVSVTNGTATTTFTCRSSNTAVATVAQSANGCTATAVNPGQTTVSAVLGNGNSASAQLTVNARPAAIANLALTPNAVSLAVGGQAGTVQASVQTAAGATVTYTVQSLATAVATATVSSAGAVSITAVAPGQTVVRVTASGTGANATATTLTGDINVVVAALQPGLTALTVQPTALTLPVQGSGRLSPAVTGPRASTVTYDYSSSNTAVATVANTGAMAGTVTAVTPGSAVITVRASTAAATGFEASTLTALIPVTVNALANVTIANITQGPFVTIDSGTAGLQIGVVQAPNAQVNQPVDVTNTRDQIQVTLNLQPNGQSVSRAVIEICDATAANCVDAAQQTFSNNTANAGDIQLLINTGDFTADFAAGTSRTLYSNGQRTIGAYVVDGAGNRIQAANAQRTNINFNNLDGWAIQFVRPARTAQGGNNQVPTPTSLANLNWFGGPGADGQGAWTIVPVVYTPGRSIQTVTTDITQGFLGDVATNTNAQICRGSATFTSASALPWRNTFNSDTTTASSTVRNHGCGSAPFRTNAAGGPIVGYEHPPLSAPNQFALNFPAVISALDNSNNPYPIVRAPRGYRANNRSGADAVARPVPIRLDYNQPTINWTLGTQPQTFNAVGAVAQFWMNSTYNFARTAVSSSTTPNNQAINFTDGGAGLPTTLGTTYAFAGCPLTAPRFPTDVTNPQTPQWAAAPRTAMTTNTGADIPECATDFTGGATPGPYIVDATQADVLGNTATVSSPRFGVDKTNPNLRFGPPDSLSPDTTVFVSFNPGDTVFNGQFLDERSGFVPDAIGAYQHFLAVANQQFNTGRCLVSSTSPSSDTLVGPAFITAPTCGHTAAALTLPPNSQPTLGDGFRQARAILGSDLGATNAYFTYGARVIDRAGNITTLPPRRIARDFTQIEITGLGVPGLLTAAGPNNFVPNYADDVELWAASLRFIFPNLNTTSSATPDTLAWGLNQVEARFNDNILLNGNATLAAPAGTQYTGLEVTGAGTDGIIGFPSNTRPTAAATQLFGIQGTPSTVLTVPLLSGNVAASTDWSQTTVGPNIISWKMDSLRAAFNAPQGPKAIVRANTNVINAPFSRVDFFRKATSTLGDQTRWDYLASVPASAAIPSDGGSFRTWSYVFPSTGLANQAFPNYTGAGNRQRANLQAQTAPVAGQVIIACGVKADGRALCTDPFMASFGGAFLQ
jgi:hypothetical protein